MILDLGLFLHETQCCHLVNAVIRIATNSKLTFMFYGFSVSCFPVAAFVETFSLVLKHIGYVKAVDMSFLEADKAHNQER